MTVQFDYETEIPFSFSCEEVAEQTVQAVLDWFVCPYETEVSIVLTDNDGIWSVNRSFRGIDAPTDVLSFPACEYLEPADFSNLDEDSDCFNPDTGELILGDMMISAERVKSQAKEYGHSELREFAFLIVHSMLHLLGYDHVDDDEQEEMEQLQEQILTKMGITRGENA